MIRTLAIVLTIAYATAIVVTAKLMKTRRRQDTRAELDAYYRRGVEVAGGVYVGIQEIEGESGLVLFNHPKTGSTLAVSEKNFTAVAVENRLGQHEVEWGVD